MKNNIEIYFDKTFKFADMYFDDAKSLLKSFDNSALYFVMSFPKLKIIDLKFKNNTVFIYYKNLISNKTEIINNISFFNFDISCKHIEMNISNAGTYIEYGLTEEGRRYIQEHYPYIYEQEDFSVKSKISIYDLLFHSNSNKDTIYEYEVLYIGQSCDINNRLENHEHILRIYRDSNRENDKKEIMVWLLHPKTKLFQYVDLENLKASIVLGDSNWEEKSHLASRIGQKEMLDIAKALLIRIFQPYYNITYKNSRANIRQKTYLKLFDEGIDKVTLTLNLFLESTHEILHIKSATFDTEKYKGILFDCFIVDLFKKPKASINIDKIDNMRFNFLYK